jgi:hypothetical protein
VKVLNVKVKVNRTGTISLLLLVAPLLGFTSVMPTAVASLPIDDTTTDDGTPTTTMSDNTSLNGTTLTTTTTTTVELADEPFAVGHYRTVSDNMTSEGQVEFTFEGNTTITLPNSTEMITTRDTGQGNVTFLPRGGAVIRAQIHMTTEDGSENATGDFTEFMKSDESTGIGVGYFGTSSTGGMLAPLNNMIAVFLDEIQPNEDSIVRFFEWKSDGGAPIGNGNVTTIGGGNDTTTATANTEIPNVSIP